MSSKPLFPSRRAVTLSMLAAATTPACAREPEPEESVARVAPAPGFSRGIGMHHLMNRPRTINGPYSPYKWPPFDHPIYRSTDEEFANVKRVGFDFVRMTVDPGIFMDSRGERLQFLLDMMRSNVERLRAAGLNVIVDLHPTSNSDAYTPERIIASAQSRLFGRYVEVVAAIARLLSTMGDGIWFELMNEPEHEGPGSSARWRAMALQLAQAARAEAPNLTLVIDSNEMASWIALTNFTPLPASLGPLVYTFHYYSPARFTMQSRIESARYITHMEWPPNPERLQTTIAQARANVMADAELSAAERERVASRQQRWIEEYYADPQRIEDVRSDIAAVAAWADRHRIPRSSVLLGEFGVTRTYWQYTAADEPSRELWLRTVRTEAERHGFPWSVWLYRGGGGMGITNNDNPLEFDPLSLRALGLTES